MRGSIKSSKNLWTKFGIVYRCWTEIGFVYRFRAEIGPFPPRRETPVRVLPQKPSSQARLHFKTLQGDFRTYTQSRFLASTYTQSRFLTATYTQSRFLTARYAFRR